MAEKPNVKPDKPKLTKRIFLVLRKSPELLARYTLAEENLARKTVAEVLIEAIPSINTATVGFDIVSLPSRPSVMMERGYHSIAAGIDKLIVVLMVSPKDIKFFQDIPKTAPADTVTGFGVDAPVSVGGYWAGGIGMGNTFSTRAAAELLIKRDALVRDGTLLTGQGVHVALIDSGLDVVERQQLGLSFGVTIPGQEHLNALPEAPAAPRYDHAFAMARSFKSIAPDVTIHDFAVLPPRLSKTLIPNIGIRPVAFISDMHAAYIALANLILEYRNNGDNSPWVVVNAWSVYRRNWAISDQSAYDNLDLITHPLNASIAEVSTLGADIIFCAGNGGQFGNDPRCGPEDIGPGYSIIGPNGHPDVITVGAVRTDGGWIGSSSQGPGIMGKQLEAIQKPDIAAPSDFIENDDGSQLNSGTSTACAVTAATVAALRQGWPTTHRLAFKAALLTKARQMEEAGWNNRTGHGILNIEALTAQPTVALGQ
jgi:hypothetical protein